MGRTAHAMWWWSAGHVSALCPAQRCRSAGLFHGFYSRGTVAGTPDRTPPIHHTSAEHASDPVGAAVPDSRRTVSLVPPA